MQDNDIIMANVPSHILKPNFGTKYLTVFLNCLLYGCRTAQTHEFLCWLNLYWYFVQCPILLLCPSQPSFTQLLLWLFVPRFVACFGSIVNIALHCTLLAIFVYWSVANIFCCTLKYDYKLCYLAWSLFIVWALCDNNWKKISFNWPFE